MRNEYQPTKSRLRLFKLVLQQVCYFYSSAILFKLIYWHVLSPHLILLVKTHVIFKSLNDVYERKHTNSGMCCRENTATIDLFSLCVFVFPFQKWENKVYKLKWLFSLVIMYARLKSKFYVCQIEVNFTVRNALLRKEQKKKHLLCRIRGICSHTRWNVWRYEKVMYLRKWTGMVQLNSGSKTTNPATTGQREIGTRSMRTHTQPPSDVITIGKRGLW